MIDLTDRQQVVFDFIRESVERDYHPSDPAISAGTGIPLSSLGTILARLRSYGLFRNYRIKNQRHFDLLDTSPVEPVRVEHFSCPRCGARNCTRHNAAYLTVGRVPAWRIAA